MAVNVVLKSVWDDKGIKEATSSLNKISDGIATTFKAVGVATAVAAAAIVKFGADSIAAAENVAQANARLGQVAKSMGLFGAETEAVTQRLIDFAEANELSVAVDAEVIKATQAKLLTFKNLAQTADDMGGSFDRATMAALDLAAAGFGSAETNAVQLGKALQDPIKGITALARSGVTFTAQEREKIKVLVESGKTLEAQNLILQAIETQVGGTAQATAKASDRMKLAFDNISEAVGEAMLPAYEDMVDIIINDIIPIFTDVAEDVGPAMADALKFIAEVFDEAMTEGTDLNKALGKLEDSFGLLFSAITNGQNDAEGFADFLANLVLIVEFLTTTLAAVIAGFQGIGIAFDALARGDFETFWKFLTMDTIEFIEEMKNAENATNRLNSIDLSKFRGQLGDTRVDALRLVNAQKQLYYAMRGLPMPTTPDTTDDDTVDETTRNVESSFEKVQKFIKNAQNDLARAQEKYNKSLATSQKKYAETVLKTERDFAEKLANIVQQSQDRLRTAFANVVRVSLADIFEVEETKSVANLVSGLTNRLRKSQALLERAGKLNAAGFSQTFIEQVVAAGTETGNELAQAILDATPETQRELQSLFSAIETTAETGMDSLARQIYESAGLATTELRNLYAQTQTELTEALLKLKEDFDQEVLDANNVLIDAVKDIRAAFKENIDSMKGDLGGLGKVVDEFFKKLGKVEAEAAKAITPVPGATPGAGATGGATGINVLASSVTNATGILIDSATDVAKVLDYLTERIVAANEFAAQSINRGQMAAATSAQQTRDELMAQLRVLRAAGPSAVGTVINVNVKTDSTQSLAMVGKSLGNTITKYVQSGGQVVVSPVG